MFSSLLIANRGEIACRIIRTARAMGIRTVAVYSDADAKALHVRQADEAVHIGASPARESYLVGAKIIAAAKASGAEAIHPGYGFLSENAEFAQSVIDAGLIWVGPKPASITAMGLKDAAKKLMAAAGVPVTPGYLGIAGHLVGEAGAAIAENATLGPFCSFIIALTMSPMLNTPTTFSPSITGKWRMCLSLINRIQSSISCIGETVKTPEVITS